MLINKGALADLLPDRHLVSPNKMLAAFACQVFALTKDRITVTALSSGRSKEFLLLSLVSWIPSSELTV